MGRAEVFRGELFEAGLLVPAGALGVYHRSAEFEAVVRGLEAYVSAAGRADKSRRLFSPPIVPTSNMVDSGYIDTFPDLLGTVWSFKDKESLVAEMVRRAQAGEPWQDMLSPTDLSLCPAACHSVYPMHANSTVPVDGLRYETQAVCFRHEPSEDPARMQTFRMHEFIFIGAPGDAVAHRERWLEKAQDLLRALGLTVESAVANDPFFGRAGRLLAAGQRARALKYELVASISSDAPGAICSANYHEDHFGVTYGIDLEGGALVHTACFGFGLERTTLALFYAHGVHSAKWPSETRRLLGLGDEAGS
jgi:seryl-tRNA synthetase